MPTAQNIKRLTIASTLSIGLVALAIACGDTTPTNSVDMTTTPPDMAMEPPADLTMETVIVRPPLLYGPHMRGNMLRWFKIVDRGLPLPFGS